MVRIMCISGDCRCASLHPSRDSSAFIFHRLFFSCRHGASHILMSRRHVSISFVKIEDCPNQPSLITVKTDFFSVSHGSVHAKQISTHRQDRSIQLSHHTPSRQNHVVSIHREDSLYVSNSRIEPDKILRTNDSLSLLSAALSTCNREMVRLIYGPEKHQYLSLYSLPDMQYNIYRDGYTQGPLNMRRAVSLHTYRHLQMKEARTEKDVEEM